jgi:hypothetical protein
MIRLHAVCGVNWNRWDMLICPGWPQSGSVFPVLVTVSHFEQQVNIKLFCKLGRLAAGTVVSLNAVYGYKVLENTVYK